MYKVDKEQVVATESGLRRSKLIGFGCLLITACGWGLNWPATKLLLKQCPPLSARGVSGIVASLALGGLAYSRGEVLSVPRHLWGRLTFTAILNVSAWMGLTTVSLLWLNAGEAATLAYTMPLWAALLAWPLLGEQPAPRRITALALGCGGVIVLVGGTGHGLALEVGKTPGIVLALAAATLFALGTIVSKRAPIGMSPIALAAWQVGIGCVPLLAASLIFEHPHFRDLPLFGWIALAYTAGISLGLCYLTWFAALRRLKAGTAAIGMLLTPIIGVTSSSLALGEPFQLPQIASLILILGGVALTVRD